MSAATDTVVATNPAPIEQVIARVKQVYGGWKRTTSVEQMRRDWDELFWNDAFPAKSEPVSANGVDAMWIDAAAADPAKAMLYIHGGGFRMGSVRSHYDLIARLSAAAGCRALGINYRLAPEHRYPAPIEDVVAAYRWLLAQGFAPHNIVFAADSCGVTLALSALLALREQGNPLPAAAALMSAWTDLASTGASYVTRAAADPIHQHAMMEPMARHYLGDAVDLRDPAASPYYAELHGLPPLLLQVGGREISVDDSLNFAAKARAAGVAAQVEVWDGMIHVFQQFTTELPQARQAIESIGRFFNSRWRLA